MALNSPANGIILSVRTLGTSFVLGERDSDKGGVRGPGKSQYNITQSMYLPLSVEA